MAVFIETDIGRDPDDFFALCYLFDAGIDIKMISVSPGDKDQLAFVNFFLNEIDRTDVLFGPSQRWRNKSSVSGIHLILMDRYKFSHSYEMPMGRYASNMIYDHWKEDDTLFIIGPMTGSAEFIDNYKPKINRAFIQGGYLSYEEQMGHGLYPSVQLEKFIGKRSVPSFNLCGDKQAAIDVINYDINDRRFISKNLCHTIVYDKNIHDLIMSVSPKSRSGELFREGMSLYLEKHHEGKKFHDPLAAVCMVHPEIATWVRGNMICDDGKWRTSIDSCGTSFMASDVDRDAFWMHIANGD